MAVPSGRQVSGFLPHLASHVLAGLISLASDGLSSLGMHRAAEGLICFFLRRLPNEDLLPLQLATIHERAGHLDQAIACLTELLRRGREQARYHFELALLYERHAQYHLALAHFEKSLAAAAMSAAAFRAYVGSKIDSTRRKLAETASGR